MSATKDYKPFIDGLRAIAVTSVVAYHAGIPGITGGYVGVDIFFVISGFLIINQIIHNLQKGNFSFADFWSRRAIRILPSYLLVILSSIIAGFFVLVEPSEFASFGQEVLWSAGMVVNHLFLSQEGYFDSAADSKPLLHLWSLSVEEQFYVVAPLILVSLWSLGKLRRTILFTVGVSIFLASLVGCILFTQGDKNYAFYVMALRSWQFIAGGAVVLFATYVARHRLLNEATGLAGLAAILASVLRFNHDTVFPGYAAILPTLGTCAVILAGYSNQKIIVARLLAIKPMVWVGLVSYAWYLWHWPILVFGRMYMFETPTLGANVSFALISFVLAAYTYIYIEKPLKVWRRSEGFSWHGWKPAIVGASASAQIAILGLIIVSIISPRLQFAWPKSLVSVETKESNACDGPDFNVSACRRQLSGRAPGIIMGDSHARTATYGLNRALAAEGGGLLSITSGGCAPFTRARLYRTSGNPFKECENTMSTGLSQASSKFKPKFAVLAARWNIYVPNTLTMGNSTRRLIGDVNSNSPKKDQNEAFASHLKTTLSDLQKNGVQSVLIIAPLPEFNRNPSKCIPRALGYNMQLSETCGEARPLIEERRSNAMRLINSVIRASTLPIKIYDPINLFCDKTLCSPYQNGQLMFRDSDHLSKNGVDYLSDSMAEILSWLAS